MWRVETSRLGRIVIPPFLPPGFGVFSTTLDLHGRITPDVERDIAATIRERFALDTTLTTCHQIHSANVTRAQRASEWRECDACDALWSDDKHVALGIKVADCLPITMVDPAHGIIANVHSGWRGAAQRIAAAAIDASAIDASASYAYLGPSIRVCCFEVGEEVVEQLAGDEVFVDRTRAKPHVDLAAFTIDILRARGFAGDRIFDSQLCTRCDGSIFHSYRRGSAGGRNLAIVAQ
ncbi:MAG TPA: polyphenol oxidase family protein [Thermoanaerobaculia bacterium]|nr:polyphenol oxidase family protein [Thermoanaerobaculia bacterium]